MRDGGHPWHAIGILRQPAWRFGLGLAIAIIASIVTVTIAARQPRAGMTFAPDGSAVSVVGGEIHQPTRLTGIGRGALSIDATDLTAEPDGLPTYAIVDAMIARQEAIVAALRSDRIIRVAAPGGDRLVPIHERRGIRYLPGGFWMQLTIAFVGFTISCWVWAVAPRKLPNILFGITGLAILVLVDAAAIYSTRELAIPSRLFWNLQALNHAGAATFGAAMWSMFLVYPRRLAPNGILVGIAVATLIAVCSNQLRLVPSPALGGSLTTSVQMVGIALTIGWQFLCTRGDPIGRAALRWIGLTALIGPGMFIGMVAVPAVLGRPPIVDQGLAFGFFLLVHVGTAIGLGRDRLFAIDNWSLALLLYGVVGAVFLIVDLALSLLLGSISEAAAVTGLLLLPLLYLPARDRLMRRIAGRAELGDVLEEVTRVALSAERATRERLWRAALDHAFAPLQINPAEAAPRCAIVDAGTSMVVPGVAGDSAVTLRLARRGSRLFTPADLALAERMRDLAGQVDRDRRAYDRGINAERTRVSRDLHDDLAARLMGGLTLDDPARLRETIRAALAEVRGIVSATLSGPAPVVDLLADSRMETADRLDSAGIKLDWSPNVLIGTLSAEACKALSSTLRELTTNVLRHSHARTMRVITRTGDGQLHLRVEDDGIAAGDIVTTGNGLGNIEHRLRGVGGSARFEARGGFRATLAVPVV